MPVSAMISRKHALHLSPYRRIDMPMRFVNCTSRRVVKDDPESSPSESSSGGTPSPPPPPLKKMFVHDEKEAIGAGILVKLAKQDPRDVEWNPSMEDALDALTAEDDDAKLEDVACDLEGDESISAAEPAGRSPPPVPKSSKMPGRWSSIDVFGVDHPSEFSSPSSSVSPAPRPIFNHLLEHNLPQPELRERFRAAQLKLPDATLDYLDHVRGIPALTGAARAHFGAFEDVPWPVHGWPASLPELRDADIRAFYNDGPMAMLGRARMLQTYRLWHPDNFARRTAGRVVVDPEHAAEIRRGMRRVARVVLVEAKKRQQRVSGKVIVASPRKKRHREIRVHHVPDKRV